LDFGLIRPVLFSLFYPGHWGLPCAFIYTYRGGIKTVVWTDTLQTFFMLAAVVITIFYIGNELGIKSLGDYVSAVAKDSRSEIFNWDWKAGTNFFKQFISGAFITIVMTGLDQDMMQKNLTCKNIGDAQKNMFWFTIILVIVNLLFLSLGVMLYIYAETKGIPLPAKSDQLFPLLATQHFSAFTGIVFVLGITAAAYSSADSTLTALTTSFCIDFLQIERKYASEKRVSIRKKVHILFTALMFFMILGFYWLNDQSVINSVFIIAGYTYGPLLGLYSFGLFTKLKVKDRFVPYIAAAAPIITYVISQNSEKWLWGYKFGFEALILNGALMFLGLFLLHKKN
jgi:Na+/proline symporter